MPALVRADRSMVLLGVPSFFGVITILVHHVSGVPIGTLSRTPLATSASRLAFTSFLKWRGTGDGFVTHTGVASGFVKLEPQETSHGMMLTSGRLLEECTDLQKPLSIYTQRDVVTVQSREELQFACLKLIKICLFVNNKHRRLFACLGQANKGSQVGNCQFTT